MLKYTKVPFDNNENEKAYMLGLRAGDFYSKWDHNLIVIGTTTTKNELIELFQQTFSPFGQVIVRKRKQTYKSKTIFQIYCYLDKTFKFLVEKPLCIPKWILKNKNYFLAFLGGYTDCEGCFFANKNVNCNTFSFGLSISSGDYKILLQAQHKLLEFGFNFTFRLKTLKGTLTQFGRICKDIYELKLLRKKQIIPFFILMVPFLRHEEKINKANVITTQLNEETKLKQIKHEKSLENIKKYQKNYRQLNKARLNELNKKWVKKWRKENYERIKIYSKKYYFKNKSKFRKYRLRYYVANHAKILRQKKVYYQSNKGLMKQKAEEHRIMKDLLMKRQSNEK